MSNHWSDTAETGTVQPDGSLAEYEVLLNDLSHTIHRLESRLDHVLHQHEDTADREKLVQLPMPAIRGQNDRLRQMSISLERIIDRIDL